MTGASGKAWRCDWVQAELKVVVEYDGNFWHGPLASAGRDEAKTEDLEGVGWVMIRVREKGLPALGDHDITCKWEWPARKIVHHVVRRLVDLGIVPMEVLDGYPLRGEALSVEVAGRRWADYCSERAARDAAEGRGPRVRKGVRFTKKDADGCAA